LPKSAARRNGRVVAISRPDRECLAWIADRVHGLGDSGDALVRIVGIRYVRHADRGDGVEDGGREIQVLFPLLGIVGSSVTTAPRARDSTTGSRVVTYAAACATP
jgi:hypothetical protein